MSAANEITRTMQTMLSVLVFTRESVVSIRGTSTYTAAVHRQPRTMYDASVYEHSVLYQMQTHLPAPSDERESKEDHDDRKDRICAQIPDAVHYFYTGVLPERIEPVWIDLSVDHVDIFLDLLAYAVHLIIALFLSSVAEPEAEVLSEESFYRSELYPVFFI